MSLVGLVCNCSSAEPLIRQSLRAWGHPDPFAVRLYRGDEAKAFVNKNHLNDLIAHLNRNSSYAIVMGWGDDKVVHWADLNYPSVASTADAKIIVETFA